MYISRRAGAALVPAAVIATMMLGASAASAAPYTTAASVSVSPSNPCIEDELRVSGLNFAAGERIALDLHSDTERLGTVSADGDGSFATTVDLPDDAIGDHFITATGLTSHRSARADIDIRRCGDEDHENSDHDHSEEHHGVSGGGISLPGTGAEVAGLLGVGGLLVGGGVVLARIRRRNGAG
jgi:LPXTG-motif cell wall-anchored protein